MLRRVIICSLVLGLLRLVSPSAGRAAQLMLDFAGDAPGRMPSGFSSRLIGLGAPGDWQLVEDEAPSPLAPFSSKANASTGRRSVLAQVSRDSTDERFPVLLYDGETFGDFSLTTRFKLVGGRREQMAGLVFRFVDDANFYYIRASGLGNTFNFFKVINGQRSAPITGRVEVRPGVWHEMSIECSGTRIRARLDGQEIWPELDDKSLSAGRIGFWTKSDSVSYFSELKIDYKQRETLAQVLVRDTLQKYPKLLGVKIYATPPGGRTDAPLQTVASSERDEFGQPAPDEARRVLAERGFFYGKRSGVISMTLPLHDSNGDKIAAVRVLMKSFPGQTENNAVVRAMPVVKNMEARIRSLSDLLQ